VQLNVVFIYNGGYKIIYKIHPAISLSDWSLFDCHKYIVDFETCVTKAVAALEVAGLDQLRKNQKETIQKVEFQVTLERESALELIRKHIVRPAGLWPSVPKLETGLLNAEGVNRKSKVYSRVE
jgi:hypothetical protein